MLKKLVLLSSVSYFVLTGSAHAEPITTALFGAAFAATTAGAIVSYGIGVAISLVASSLLSSATSSSSTGTSGVKLEIDMGDTNPVSVIAGRYATSGRRKYIGTWGNDGSTPNAFLTEVVEIGNLPSYAGYRGLNSVWINDEQCTVLWDEPDSAGRGYPLDNFRRDDGSPNLWVKYLDGTQTSADSFLVSKFGSDSDRPFTSAMIGRGCQAVILTTRYDNNQFTSIPTGLYEPAPARFYDLRKDSTNGGSGSHRWSDPSTWEGAYNPVVAIYNIIRGMSYGDEWFYGGQNLPAFRLPSSSWISAANECDSQVALSSGGSENAYRFGYELLGNEKPIDAVKKLLKACNARMAEVGGIFKIIVGSPGSALYSFTDDDVVITDSQSFSPFKTLDATINGIEATYPEPLEAWATKDAPALYDDSYRLLDDNRLLIESVSFEAAPFPNQVQRLMRAILNDGRQDRTHKFFLPPDAYALEPNDVVSYTSERNGYAAKKFLVTQIEGQQSHRQFVYLKETDPADYDWSTSFELPTAVGWTGSISVPSQPMYGWQALPATIYDSEGRARRPSIQVSCDSGQDDVRNVWVQVRLKSSEAVVFDSNATAYATPYTWVLNGVFLSATTYQVRGKFVPYTSRATDWSDWIDVTTPDVRFLAGADYDPYEGVVGLSTLGPDLADYLDWVGSGVRDIQSTMEELDARIADLDLASGTMRNQIRININAEFENVRADYTSQIDVIAGEAAAVATSVTTLTATFNAQTATFNSQISTLSAADTALSSRVDTLTATLTDPTTGLQATASAVSSLSATVTSLDGDVTAVATALTSLSAASSTGDVNSANFRMSLMTGPTGYSRIGAEARAGGSGDYRTAAWYLDVPNDASLPTRFLVEAGQFIVVAGGNLNNPFVVDGTAVRMNVANIGTVTAGVMQSSNGKMVINLTDGTIVISS